MKPGLAGLIRALAAVDGLEAYPHTTSHPNDMDDALIAAHGEVDKLMPYLHLPVQSGSDRILKAMNRKHTAEGYLRLIERIRDARPDLHLSATSLSASPVKPDADSKIRWRSCRRRGLEPPIRSSIRRALAHRRRKKPQRWLMRMWPANGCIGCRTRSMHSKRRCRMPWWARTVGAVRKARSDAGSDGRQI